MADYQKLNLETMYGNQICFDREVLKPLEEELLAQLDGEDYPRNIQFAKSVMMSQEINANNLIEGIKNDLSIIDEVIRRRKSNLSESQKRRIINLYHGYQFILTHKRINKESLRKLYALLSEDILEDGDLQNMGEYYRNKPVYIFNKSHVSYDYFMGVEASQVEYFMQQYFNFINSQVLEEDEMDIFLKSQIMHFYFVYIHPYFDVNGRTSRTVSMWFLLQHEAYPYIIFNRAIAFLKKEYLNSIVESRDHGDITSFLQYMLIAVERELEKEYVIFKIQSLINEELSKEDVQLLEYFLTMKGNLTLKDLVAFYNHYNESRKPLQLYEEKILPLITRSILVAASETKGKITPSLPNFRLGINRDLVLVQEDKVKHLDLDRKVY